MDKKTDKKTDKKIPNKLQPKPELSTMEKYHQKLIQGWKEDGYTEKQIAEFLEAL